MTFDDYVDSLMKLHIEYSKGNITLSRLESSVYFILNKIYLYYPEHLLEFMNYSKQFFNFAYEIKEKENV